MVEGIGKILRIMDKARERMIMACYHSGERFVYRFRTILRRIRTIARDLKIPGVD